MKKNMIGVTCYIQILTSVIGNTYIFNICRPDETGETEHEKR